MLNSGKQTRQHDNGMTLLVSIRSLAGSLAAPLNNATASLLHYTVAAAFFTCTAVADEQLYGGTYGIVRHIGGLAAAAAVGVDDHEEQEQEQEQEQWASVRWLVPSHGSSRVVPWRLLANGRIGRSGSCRGQQQHQATEEG
eukprot:jgi/Chlat1/8412/Chrsp80S09225